VSTDRPGDGVWDTPFTRLVGCRLPLQEAVMGSDTGGALLAAAVTNAGGLGMLSESGVRPLGERLDWLEQHADGPFGVGFFAFVVRSQLDELERAAARARVIDLFWGTPDPALVERIHTGGALAFWQVGSVEEARQAADAGCDAVVAQGVEAGGHVRGTTPLLELVPEVAAAVAVPVVAAGGIATGAAMAAALDAGAAAVRVGTRLLATEESNAHPDYVAALLAAGGDATVVTNAFAKDFAPDAPHRVLRTAVDAAHACARQSSIAVRRYGEAHWDVPPLSAMAATAETSGHIEAMALYAGTGVADVTDAPAAAAVIERLCADARIRLERQ
jgi:NAD(P)H-dependent flavin oxidoreductase YrpB (nitropropane dioxygenase family)